MKLCERVVRAQDGTQLYVRVHEGEQRDAPVLLFCDGLGCDGFVFKYLWPLLPQEMSFGHFQYRGHGRSQPPCDPQRIEVGDLAEDLHQVRKSLGRPVVIVGHSLGVQVALEAQLREPTGILALVLLCGTSGHTTSTFKGSDWLARLLPYLFQLVERQPRLTRALWRNMPPWLSVLAGRVLGDIPPQVESEDIRPYFEHLNEMDVSLFLRFLDAAGRHCTEQRLSQVEVPVLLLGSEADSFTPIAEMRRLASGLPRAEMHEVPRATHLLPLEEPRFLVEQVRQFLQKNQIFS